MENSFIILHTRHYFELMLLPEKIGDETHSLLGITADSDMIILYFLWVVRWDMKHTTFWVLCLLAFWAKFAIWNQLM